MQKDRIQLEDISSISAGNTAIINCPKGFRYHDINLVLGDTGKSGTGAPAVSDIVTDILVRYNGEDIWDLASAGAAALTGSSRLDVIQTANGANFASQAYTGASGNGLGRRHLSLNFAQPWQDTGQDRELLALPTDWLPDSGKLQILLALATGITPLVTAWATVDSMQVGKPQAVLKMQTHDFNVSSNALQLTNQLPRSGLYSELSLFDTSDSKTVEAVEIKVGRVTRWDLSKNENTTDMKRNLMNPAAGAYHVNFDQNNGIVDFWDPSGAGDMVVKATLSAAASGTLSIVSQRLEMPKGY